jgi:hypothetical protein
MRSARGRDKLSQPVAWWVETIAFRSLYDHALLILPVVLVHLVGYKL